MTSIFASVTHADGRSARRRRPRARRARGRRAIRSRHLRRRRCRRALARARRLCAGRVGMDRTARLLGGPARARLPSRSPCRPGRRRPGRRRRGGGGLARALVDVDAERPAHDARARAGSRLRGDRAAVLLLCNTSNRAQLVWGLGGGLVVAVAGATACTSHAPPRSTPRRASALPADRLANALGGLAALALPWPSLSRCTTRDEPWCCWQERQPSSCGRALPNPEPLGLSRCRRRACRLVVANSRASHAERLEHPQRACWRPSSWASRSGRCSRGLGDRAQYWRVAWRVVERHPLLGSGAGTFDEQWLRYRGSGVSVRDAHSLYLETVPSSESSVSCSSSRSSRSRSSSAGACGIR